MPKSNSQETVVPTAGVKDVTVYIMGKPYSVPSDKTIMGAIHHVGYQLIRGAGCREGFCGACSTIYRMPGDYKFHTAQACTKLVEDKMYLAQIPFVPADRPIYDLEALEPKAATFEKIFPETFRCLACNTCTKACPQDIQVMDYIQAVIRNDIAGCADLSFDCIACGMCAIRCPAEITQHQVGLLARRLYGRYLSPKGKNLPSRIAEIKQDRYAGEIKEMMGTEKSRLKEQYHSRDIEPE